MQSSVRRADSGRILPAGEQVLSTVLVDKWVAEEDRDRAGRLPACQEVSNLPDGYGQERFVGPLLTGEQPVNWA